jgi:poly(3-hydroxybutyrate) depolymerase
MTIRFLGRVAGGVWLGSGLLLGSCRGSGARVEGPDARDVAAPASDAGPVANPVAASDCAPHAATGDEPLIDGFDGNGVLPNNDGRAGRWFFYDDGTSGQQEVEVGTDERALHVSSLGFSNWGSGLGVTLSPDSTQTRSCPYDASVHGGLSFRVRGSGRIRLRVAMPETTPIADGGECTLAGENCYDWPGAWLVLDSEWKSYTLSFCALKPEGWSGAALPLDPSRISALHFMLEGETDLWLDGLTFAPVDKSEENACFGLCPLAAAPPEIVDPGRTWLALSDTLSLHTFDQETPRCGPIARRYLSYVPATLSPNSDAPVVVALHGSGANAESFQETMARGGLDALAERDGFVMVYGNAAPGAYSEAELLNSGAWRQAYFDDGQIDDVAYLQAVLEDLERRGVISGDNALFLIGLSNGGGMVLDAARRWPERITGIAPFMAFDGFEPSAVPALGGTPLRRVLFGYAPFDPGMPEGYVEGVLARLPLAWAGALGLPDAPKVELLPDQVVEGAQYTGSAAAALATRDSRATRHDYGSASDAVRMRVLVFENAGHFWPHPEQDTEAWIVERWGFRNQDVDASAVVWEFFREALAP